MEDYTSLLYEQNPILRLCIECCNDYYDDRNIGGKKRKGQEGNPQEICDNGACNGCDSNLRTKARADSISSGYLSSQTTPEAYFFHQPRIDLSDNCHRLSLLGNAYWSQPNADVDHCDSFKSTLRRDSGSSETADLIAIIEERLRSIESFRMCSEAMINRAARCMHRVKYTSNETVFRQGEIEASFYMLAKSEDKSKLIIAENISDAEGVKLIKECSSNAEFFGETCLRCDDAQHAFSLVAVADVIILQLKPELYRQLMIHEYRLEESRKIEFLSRVRFLEKLPEAQLQPLSRSLEKKTFADGDVIISEGTEGDTFYIVEKGIVKCVQRTRKGSNVVSNEVARYAEGDYFGEGALLQNVPRTADILAVGEVTCFTLHRKQFHDLLGDLQYSFEHNFRVRLLKGVDVLSSLADWERSELAYNLEEKTFRPGSRILQQGEYGDEFYIIKSGEVSFINESPTACEGANLLNSPEKNTPSTLRSIAGETESLLRKSSRSASFDATQQEVGRLFKGQYFGEGALLTDKPRRLTAVAVTTVTLFSLGKSTFLKAFDETLQQRISRNFDKRKQGSDEPIEFEDLEQLKILGAGNFGQVLLVSNKITGMTYALKTIARYRTMTQESRQQILNERKILKSINHPFVVQLKETYVARDYLFILLEAVLGGDFFTYLNRVGSVSTNHALFYVGQIVLVFEELHSKGIVYRDLKPENLLIGANGYLKFVDFGLSKIVHKNKKTYTLCGTPTYAAPEIYDLSGHGPECDWWSLGVFVHEIISGVPPFDGTPHEIFASLLHYRAAYPNIVLPKSISGHASDLVLKLLNPSPDKRLGSSSQSRIVRNHPFFNGFFWNKILAERIEAPFQPTISSGFDTNNFRVPAVQGEVLQIEKIDAKSIRTATDWNF